MQGQTPIPPTPPVAPVLAPGGQLLGTTSPSATYEAFRHQRDVLGNQLDRLEDQRREISQSLQQLGLNSVDQKALEQRLTVVDGRITDVEKQIAAADLQIAKSAAIPGAVVERPDPGRQGPPEEAFVLGGLFMIVVLLPISIALARRIWRRGAATLSKLPQELYDRFARLDQSIDAIAVEVERIGEGQRFLTKLQTDQRALGAGPAERIEMPERQREKHTR